MSLIDNIFGRIPTSLISQWGIDIIYIKASQNQSYDPCTGTILGVETEIKAKAYLSGVEPEEAEGFYQQGAVKFLIPAFYLGDYYPRISDSIRYEQAGVERTAKVVKPASYRGDGPIMHAIIAKVG